MSSKGFSEDASTLLYLVPFVAAGAYGLYLWVTSGISAFLPTTVYLSVTRDPYIFMVGSLSVMIGAIMELSSTDQARRSSKLDSLASTMQSIAAASLMLALFFAWYANGFGDISGAATDFIVGRFSLVFPATLVLLSFLITVRLKFSSLRDPKVLGIIVMLLVPASVFVIGRRSIALGLGASLLLVLIGLALFLLRGREKPESEKT